MATARWMGPRSRSNSCRTKLGHICSLLRTNCVPTAPGAGIAIRRPGRWSRKRSMIARTVLRRATPNRSRRDGRARRHEQQQAEQDGDRTQQDQARSRPLRRLKATSAKEHDTTKASCPNSEVKSLMHIWPICVRCAGLRDNVSVDFGYRLSASGGPHPCLSNNVSPKDMFSSGLLRAAVVSGVVSGLAAAALGGGVPKANATCIGFSGIDIGVGCTTQLGTIAAVLGPGTATARGFFTGAIAIGDAAALADGLATAVWAGGTGSDASADGTLSWAFAQGGGNSLGRRGVTQLCLQHLWRGQHRLGRRPFTGQGHKRRRQRQHGQHTRPVEHRHQSSG